MIVLTIYTHQYIHSTYCKTSLDILYIYIVLLVLYIYIYIYQLQNPTQRAEVVDALRRLKRSKAAGELHKYGGDELVSLVQDLQSKVLTVHGEVKEVRAGYLLPLSKPGKPKKAENSRPPTLLSAFRKTSTVLARVEEEVSTLLPHHQHGARKKRSTSEITWTIQTLRATVGRYVERSQYLATGTSKALDSVTREKLTGVLEEHRLADGDSLRVIQYLMSKTTLKTRVAGAKGEEFETVSGIPQGDALSPTLFAVYLEWIMRIHRERYPSRRVPEDVVLQYADGTKMLFHDRDPTQRHGPHSGM